MASDLGRHIEAVCRHFWGDPNRSLSRGHELRFGSKGGRSVDLQKGVWTDHEGGHPSGIDAGGVLDLIQREKGIANGAAIDWMRGDLRLDVADDGIHLPREKAKRDRGKLVATYDYVDESGALVSQALRFEQPAIGDAKPVKTFAQRRPDPDAKDGWAWNLDGVRSVPYKLPELMEAIALEHRVFIVEGEKKADKLWASGTPATCAPMGAGKWPEHFAEWFGGAVVTILPDNDDAGRNHAQVVARRLGSAPASINIVPLPGLVDAKEDVIEWLDKRGGTIEGLHELAALAPAWDPNAKPPYQPRFGPLAWRDVFATAPSYPWIVKGLIPEREAVLMYGAPQTGKSFISQDLALSIARGLPVFGRTARRAGVVYCAFEGGRGFRKRQLAYAIHHRLGPEDDVPMIVLTKRADLFGDADFDPLCLEIDEMARRLSAPLGLIVFDTWSAMTPGANENASEDVSKTRARVVLAIERFGCANLTIHHKPAGGGKPRGHSSLVGDFETTIDVDWAEGGPDLHNRKIRTADMTKQREEGQGLLGRFVLQPVTVGHEEDGSEITSCVVCEPEELGGDASPKPGRKRLSDRARIALQALRDALRDSGEPAPATLHLPYGAQVVRYEQWRDLCQRRIFNPGDETTPGALRQAMHRIGEELTAKRIIAKDNPFIWILREPSE
jgi:hypothetical protein